MLANSMMVKVLLALYKVRADTLRSSSFTLLMSILTGWTLKCSRHVPAIGLRASSWPHKVRNLGKAYIMLWETPCDRGSKMQFVARLIESDQRSDVDPWLSIASEYCLKISNSF